MNISLKAREGQNRKKAEDAAAVTHSSEDDYCELYTQLILRIYRRGSQSPRPLDLSVSLRRFHGIMRQLQKTGDETSSALETEDADSQVHLGDSEEDASEEEGPFIKDNTVSYRGR